MTYATGDFAAFHWKGTQSVHVNLACKGVKMRIDGSCVQVVACSFRTIVMRYPHLIQGYPKRIENSLHFRDAKFFGGN